MRRYRESAECINSSSWKAWAWNWKQQTKKKFLAIRLLVAQMSLNSWCKHSNGPDLTTVTHCFRVRHGQPLQRVTNAAACVIMDLLVCDHVKSAATLATSQAKNHIQAVSTHAPDSHQTVSLTNCVSTISSAASRYKLRSTETEERTRTRTKIGERDFWYCGPAASNSLPSDLPDVINTNTCKNGPSVYVLKTAYQ